MCAVLLPPGGYPIAVNKYIISIRKKENNKCDIYIYIYLYMAYSVLTFLIGDWDKNFA